MGSGRDNGGRDGGGDAGWGNSCSPEASREDGPHPHSDLRPSALRQDDLSRVDPPTAKASHCADVGQLINSTFTFCTTLAPA